MTAPLRSFFLFNTETQKKVPVVPLSGSNEITLYSCGPTVYDFIHIGNLRTAMGADLLFRALKRAGYIVRYARNYTDIDDRIIAKANREGTTCLAITERFIREVEKDYAIAGNETPTHVLKVTDYLPQIIQMIENLLARGHAYASKGDVYFSVESFPRYGRLSHKSLEDLRTSAGARVETGEQKRSPLDFALWKAKKPGDPHWSSPWGEGRPGWHIECSAMAQSALGNKIDIHHGGEDLRFPHHENEICQSEGSCGESPFVAIWVHSAFLNMNAEKMSKSLGNVVTARNALERFPRELIRMLLLSAHYRSLIDFTDELTEHARSGLVRIYEAKAQAAQLSTKALAIPDMRAESVWGGFMATIEQTREQFITALCNDLNTPEAFAAIFSLIREWNRVCQEPRALETPSVAMAAQLFVNFLEEELGKVLGIGAMEPISFLRLLETRNYLGAQSASSSGQPSEAEIQLRVDRRIEAKLRKDFVVADAIRKELDAMGIIIKDTPQGTNWSRK